MKMSSSVKSIFPAYIKAREEMDSIYKDREGDKFKYADLPQIVQAINSATRRNGLAFFQAVGNIQGDRISVSKEENRTSSGDVISIENVLIHVSGEWMSKTAQILIDDKMPSRIQCSGASVTYGRRISALGFWFIAVEDQIESRGKENAAYKNHAELPIVDKLLFYIEAFPNPRIVEKHILDKHQILSLNSLSVDQAQSWCNVLLEKLSKANDK